MKQKLSLLLLFFLRFFARIQIAKLRLLNPRLKIIGVTGSAGKTSTIAAIKAALEPKFKVKSTAGSNSESGIPLSILGIKVTGYSLLDWLRYCLLAKLKIFSNWQKYDVLVIEMGIDAPYSPKNMSYLLSIVKPDIGVFLNVTPVHLHNFTSLDQIAREKAKLVNSTPIAIINPALKKFVTNKNIFYINPQPIKYHHPLPAIYQQSFGAAIAVAKVLGLESKSATHNLQSNFRLPPSRSTILKGLKDSQIIDSSYNSSPLACAEMLQFLSTFKGSRLAVLGDMRELGSSSADEHLKLYQLAAKTADTIISIGPETQKYFGPKAIKFLYWWQALKYLKEHLPPKSTLLVKGSQNTIFLEELIKGLLAKKSDSKLLCRQSAYWLRTKKQFKLSSS
ncbi:hypothetical protein A3K55_02405 [Candidatus Shapirobacteria bacterium RBG_13_44_7]|uniref:Mur ligase central domain-containing protein n=1 Tax=Candidatus Shapirobacteria bacterium RBG_13_44_7 TaxID=1802149 RepID=A0A1F7SKH7_9BACT|nr:MAG: hypothetical protein A3K55_02405 [Candidatus Shapirobacteria bacterium RBG_13_44_7]